MAAAFNREEGWGFPAPTTANSDITPLSQLPFGERMFPSCFQTEVAPARPQVSKNFATFPISNG